MSFPARVLFLILALASLGTGLWIASVHPVAPFPVLVAFLGVFGFLLWRPHIGLFMLPAFLPLLNFSPWTGWLIVDEFDLLVLAVVAAGYLRMPRDGAGRALASSLFLLLALVAVLVGRGAGDLSVQQMSGFSAYTTPMNSLRVGKSLLWLVLLFPLVAQAGQAFSPNKAISVFFGSCLLGSCGAVLAVLWERAFYPGLLDLATPYRTVALFWEMHLGGAALDAYLVLIAPLLVWAWRAKISLRNRVIVGAIVLAFAYVCLTTFSRGVLGALATSLVLLAVLLALHRVKRARATRASNLASFVVLFLVVAEVLLAFGADSFLRKRLVASERDFGGRVQHWQQGIGLLKTPGEWLFGIGLGQLPATLTKGGDGPSLPGAIYLLEGGGEQHSLVIEGPARAHDVYDLGGLFALSQRVDLVSDQRYRFALDMRSDQNVDMLVEVCALHLLYPASCQQREINVNSDGWQRWGTDLSGPPFKIRSWQAVGHGVLLLSVLTPGARVDVANLMLTAGGSNVLRNAGFADGQANWFPAAHSYFLPWHIDSLYLEVLIEAGVVGLLVFLAAVSVLIWRLVQAVRQGNELAPYFVASIAGSMSLGLVVSVVDMPRVATLFGLFLLWGWQCTADKRAASARISA